MDRPVRYGVISAGRMAGMTMLKLMADHPAARPVAWYELDCSRSDTAERIGRLQDKNIHQCHSLEELLSRRDLDVILNATPHYAHAQTSIQALRAGWPVVCEKPPACDLAECQAMADASRSQGQWLAIHFQHMLRPSARWLKDALCQGRLGRIRRISCLSLWWRSIDYYGRVPWAGKRYFHGLPTYDGVMANQGIHYLNQMLSLAQRTGQADIARPKSMRSALYRFHPETAMEMEDTAVCTGTLDNEERTEFCFATTTCSAESAGKNRAAEYSGLTEKHLVTIEGELGRAEWDGLAKLCVNGQPEDRFQQPDGPWPFYYHIRDVLAGRESPLTPVDQSINTMRFIFDAYKACGDRILARSWDLHDQVTPVLRHCIERFCLPAELDTPPAWA